MRKILFSHDYFDLLTLCLGSYGKIFICKSVDVFAFYNDLHFALDNGLSAWAFPAFPRGKLILDLKLLLVSYPIGNVLKDVIKNVKDFNIGEADQVLNFYPVITYS